MKKNILAYILLNLFLSSFIFCQTLQLDFVDIEGSDDVKIGSDKYYYYKDLYKANPVEKAYYYPETKIQLDSYKISKYLVTDKLFSQFLEETGFHLKVLEEYLYLNEIFAEYKNSQKIFAFGSYYESLCFCQWLSVKNKKTFRFPTNAEWEYACMDENKNKYPYGAPGGKFKSVADESDTRCIFLDYDKAVEDYSSKNVYSVYGACQFVLDSFDEKSYSDFAVNCKNPLMLSNSDLFHVRSGEWEYNSKNEAEWGLLKTGNVFFNTESGNCYDAIRLVNDEGTVFNKNTELPFMFYQRVGKLIKNDKTELCDFISPEDDILILYKSLDETKYYIFYKQNDCWTSDWIASDYLTVIDKKWYEIDR